MGTVGRRDRKAVRIDGPALRRVGASNVLALRADALDGEQTMPVDPPATETTDKVAVVVVEGALARRAYFDVCVYVDGYDAIVSRARAAFASDAVAVALAIDSPGGDAAGCFEAARALRAAADESGKPFYAVVLDGMACSAAYAIACAADVICVPALGDVGSIGCLTIHYDYSRALANEGITPTIIRSGRRKADMTPLEPLSEAARADLQAGVDEVAAAFGAWVAERRGKSAKAWLALEGRVLSGQRAVDEGLADRVASFEEALAQARAEGAKMKGLGALRAVLAVAASVSDEDVLAAAVPLVELGKRTVALTGGTAEESSGIVQAWQSSHGQLAARLESDRARAKQKHVEAVAREQRERVETVRGAVLAGKIPPGVAFADETQTAIASAYAEMSLATLRAHVAALPAHALAPTAQATDAPSSATASLTPEELAHCEATKTDPKAFAAMKAKLYGARGAQEG